MIPTPAHPAITCPYGRTGSAWSSGKHGGADFGSPGVGGTTAVAPRSGVVSGVRQPSGSTSGTTWGGAYGGQVVIDVDAFEDGSPGLWLIVAHLDQVHVAVGQRVTAGQAIGRVDSTGNSSGPHAHVEVQRGAGWIEGNHTDPQPWLDWGGTAPPPSEWRYPAGTVVHLDHLTWLGHELNADQRSISIGCWQEMLNRHPLVGGADLPVTEQWFELTAAETQKCQAQHVPPADEPLEAVYVGPQQFEHVRAATGAPYVWA